MFSLEDILGHGCEKIPEFFYLFTLIFSAPCLDWWNLMDFTWRVIPAWCATILKCPSL